MTDVIPWVLLFLAATCVVLLVLLLLRLPRGLDNSSAVLGEELRAGREEAGRAAREARDEISKGLRESNETLSTMLKSIGEVQGAQMDAVTKQVKELSESNLVSLERMRDGLENRVKDLQQDNGQRLDEMRSVIETKIKENQEELAKGLSGANETLSLALGRMGELQSGQFEVMTKRLKELSETNQSSFNVIRDSVDSRLKELQEGNEKKFEDVRKTIAEKLAENRDELSKNLKSADDTLSTTLKNLGDAQRAQLESMTKQLKDLAESNQNSLERVRTTLDSRVKELQENNDKKLDEMRKTVDEKLHETLEKRLGESFMLVSERLEAVQRGLGEMQNLATGVGDLKRVLSNVKIRGTWAEVQLEGLLEQILAPGQYQKNVRTSDDSSETVEYAVRLPGSKNDLDSRIWLPIDSKFPQEDYLRIQEAAEGGDPIALKRATDELARTIKLEGQKIHDKYINPPTTTDYAIMFLATEGLYGEVLRHPSLVEVLQTRYRIVVAGPTTLAAILTSLRMGFQTMAIEQRASEVWKVLGAVKTEFGKFGDVLDKVRNQLSTTAKTIEHTGVRTRAIERRLRAVEQLPDVDATAVLELPGTIGLDDDEAMSLEEGQLNEEVANGAQEQGDADGLDTDTNETDDGDDALV